MGLKQSSKIVKQAQGSAVENLYLSPVVMGIMTQADGRFIDVSSSCLELFGYPREEMIGRTLFELEFFLGGDNKGRAKAIRGLIKNGGGNGSWKGRLRMDSGMTKDIILSLERVHFKFDGAPVLFFIFRDVSGLFKVKKLFRDLQETLKDQDILLKQKSAALQEVISHIESEKDKIKGDIMANIVLLKPMLEKIKVRGGSQHLLNLIKEGLEDIASSYGKGITGGSLRLTIREIEICNMIKAGLISKEIAKNLFISPQTVDKHRKNIRKKMGISNTHDNLAAHLRAF